MPGLPDEPLPHDHPLVRVVQQMRWSDNMLAGLSRCLPDAAVLAQIARMVETTGSALSRALESANHLGIEQQVAALAQQAYRLEWFRQDMMESLDQVSQVAQLVYGSGLREAFDTLATQASRVLDTHNVFAELQAKLAEEEQAAEAFRGCGWLIAPSMPGWLIRRVVELHQEGRGRYATQAIAGYYRRDGGLHLRECLERWRKHPLLRPRIKVLEDAVEAHLNRKYTLSVPALWPQLEGVASEYVVRNGLTVRLGKSLDVCKAALGNPEDRSVNEWAIAETLLYQLDSSQYAYVDFRTQMRLPPQQRIVSRHTVLHGVGPAYHREAYSLRVILLLDAMSALI